MLELVEQASGQLMQLHYKAPDIVIKSPEDVPETFLERFESAFNDNSQHIFTDRFHSINTLGWYTELRDGSIQTLGQHASRIAAGSLSRSIVTGFREAALELPFMDWLDANRGFVADLVLDSLASAEEEAVTPLNPAYRVMEKSWWTRLSESKGFRYGLRPFQVSPYAFVSTGIWSKEKLLAMAHLRYHFRHFTDHQFEMALSVPLSRGVAFDVGTSYEFGRHAEAKKLVLKLSKQFSNGGIVHVGMEAQQHPTFLVGVSMTL